MALSRCTCIWLGHLRAREMADPFCPALGKHVDEIPTPRSHNHDRDAADAGADLHERP